MTFNDNSDFAPLVSARDVQKIVEIEDVERGEDFVQAGVSSLDVPFTGVVRPVEGEDRLGVPHYGLRRRQDRLSAVSRGQDVTLMNRRSKSASQKSHSERKSTVGRSPLHRELAADPRIRLRSAVIPRCFDMCHASLLHPKLISIVSRAEIITRPRTSLARSPSAHHPRPTACAPSVVFEQFALQVTDRLPRPKKI